MPYLSTLEAGLKAIEWVIKELALKNWKDLIWSYNSKLPIELNNGLKD